MPARDARDLPKRSDRGQRAPPGDHPDTPCARPSDRRLPRRGRAREAGAGGGRGRPGRTLRSTSSSRCVA